MLTQVSLAGVTNPKDLLQKTVALLETENEILRTSVNAGVIGSRSPGEWASYVFLCLPRARSASPPTASIIGSLSLPYLSAFASGAVFLLLPALTRYKQRLELMLALKGPAGSGPGGGEAGVLPPSAPRAPASGSASVGPSASSAPVATAAKGTAGASPPSPPMTCLRIFPDVALSSLTWP